jgi:hypothetical protein
MVSTRRSNGIVEDANALTLRSRTIDVESRHSNNSHELAGHETPRKRRKTGAPPVEDAGEKMAGDSPMDEGLLTVLRPKESGGEESQSSPTVPSPASRSFVKEDAVEASTLPGNQSPPESLNGGHGVYKRFESEEHDAAAGKDPDFIPLVTQNDSADAQAKAHNVPRDASDDESAPETFSVNFKQRLPFAAASKEPRSGGVKPRSSAPLNFGRKGSAPTFAAQSDRSDKVRDDELSSPPAEDISTSKRPTKVNRPALKKVKDVTKDGVTYRTVSAEGLRGQTSPWLPAKAITASKELKERLLVRKRVQNVSNGRPSKFATGR